MISYSTSGVGVTEPGGLEIRIPLHLMKDRNDRYADTIEMSVPHEDEITDLDLLLGLTDYAYRIEGDEVVFFNVTEISAAVNGYFEVAYSLNDPTFNYVDMSHSDEMTAAMSVNSLHADDTDLPLELILQLRSIQQIRDSLHCTKNGIQPGVRLPQMPVTTITLCGKSVLWSMIISLSLTLWNSRIFHPVIMEQ